MKSDYFWKEKKENSDWFETLVKHIWCPESSNSIQSHNRVINYKSLEELIQIEIK